MSLALGAASLVCAVTAIAAVAAPITVNLRVEGSTKTLFEGPVDVEPVTDPPGIPGSGSGHPCDVKDNGENGGFGATGAPPTAVLYDAATAQGLAFGAAWFESLHDFEVTQVGEDIANSGENGEFWGYAVNFTTAEVGGCQIRLSPGTEVLWAYDFFGLPHLLDLSGPSSVQAGVPFTVRVTDGQNGQPIQGAAIGEDVGGVTSMIPGSPVTDSNGYATVTLAHVGAVKLKATQSESVRSNGLAVGITAFSVPCACAPPGGGGSLKGRPVIPPNRTDLVRVAGVQNGRVYGRRSAPRLLAGTISVLEGASLREVKISLKRTHRGRCFDFSGIRGRFVRGKCARPAPFFSVGSAESFSYLLPSRLPPGKYVYDVEAVDDAGQITKLVNGVSHVVFQVK